MPRGVAVANIYVVNQLLNLTLMVNIFFLLLLILILIEDQLMLFMFYLEKRKIVACNMLDSQNLYQLYWSHDQDGHHAHIW